MRSFDSQDSKPLPKPSFPPILPTYPSCVRVRANGRARTQARSQTHARTHTCTRAGDLRRSEHEGPLRPYEQTKRHKDGRRDIRDELIALPCGRCVHCAALRSSRALCRMLRSCLRLAAAQWLRVVAALVLNKHES